MIRKKICMVGGSAVGKTSLVSRFVKGIFSERYLTSIGVSIDKKTVDVNGTPMELILWDLNGEDRFQHVSMSYLRGAAGFLLVVDGTNRASMETAVQLRSRVFESIGTVPFILLINKYDLTDEWEMKEDDYIFFRDQGWNVLETSAKSGMGVEHAFVSIASMLNPTST